MIWASRSPPMCASTPRRWLSPAKATRATRRRASSADDGENGQRVDVRLCRGWVDKWALGTMLDARERTVKLDAPPPDIGIAKILSDPEIRDRRTVAA